MTMPSDIIANHAAGICGVLATAGLAAWPLFQTRNSMLTVQLGALLMLVLHYTLLGVATAAAVNALGATQIVASLVFGTKPRLRWIGYALAGTMVAASIVTWQGFLSVLSGTGMVVVAIGRVQTSARAMRIVVLAGGPFWLAHDLLIASPVAVADALSLATGVGVLAWQRFAMARLAGLALARFWREEPAMRCGPMRPRPTLWLERSRFSLAAVPSPDVKRPSRVAIFAAPKRPASRRTRASGNA
jgi:hypothetical protein